MPKVAKYARSFSVEITFVVKTCPACSAQYAVTREFEDHKRRYDESWHCPNGHLLVFSENNVSRIEKELAQEKSRREQAEAHARHGWDEVSNLNQTLRTEKRAHGATKSVLTKTKNRVKNGVCPCCNRHFVNLESHMKTKHATWEPMPEDVTP